MGKPLAVLTLKSLSSGEGFSQAARVGLFVTIFFCRRLFPMQKKGFPLRSLLQIAAFYGAQFAPFKHGIFPKGNSTMTPKYENATHFKNFWQHGNGKELLDWSGTEPDPKIFHRFAPLFHQVDDLGDAVVRDTYLKLPYKEASALIHKYTVAPLSETADVPDSLRKLFLQMQHIPEWFDEDLANVGARFCMRTGTNALIVLRDFSLMGGYDFASLNKPLIYTGALKKGAVKRLKDTLEFWVNVTREDALKVNSEAYQLIVRTRLMHSYARLKIREKAENWNSEKWGEPINHWDMIATYTGFSLVFLQGLKKLGIKISAAEEKGVFHLWKYIGYLLSIPAEFLPDTRQQAVEQFYWWATLQEEGDEDSARLADALLQENMDNTIYKFEFQRKMLRNAHQSVNWFLLDKDVLERLQIPKPPAVFSAFPKMVLKGNQLAQKLYLNSPQRYAKLVAMGNKQQTDVLKDYIEHTPKDFHY